MFVQVIQARCTDAAGLRKQFDRWNEELAPGATGFLGSTSGVTDAGEFVGVARFESQDAAQRNSDRPEQGRWWQETSQYLEDVSFHDCTEVDEINGGGSNDAGFVQVIQGRARDKERLRSLREEIGESLRSVRPDVIGGIVAWHGDDPNQFTQVMYFTSESEAREGQEKPEMHQMQERLGDVVDGAPRYYDLRDPQLI